MLLRLFISVGVRRQRIIRVRFVQKELLTLFVSGVEKNIFYWIHEKCVFKNVTKMFG